MRLPPLNALRAFESAARNQSFLLAAQELHVSAASVSRFVKLLEADLGQALFIRYPNGVVLTQAGGDYLLAIQPSLQHISLATDKLRQQSVKSRLKIVSIPAIAETWLVSRLWSFQQAYKDIQINLVVDHQTVVDKQLANLHPNEATVVLNYSNGIRDGADSFAMPKDKLTLVCNHEIAKTLKQPSDIFNQPLLVDIDWQQDWQAWLKRAGLPTKIPNNHLDFERYSMVLHAALAGKGVAIGHTTLLESYLQTGALVAPFDITAMAEKQFYALVAQNTQCEPAEVFINWFVNGDFG